MDPFSIDRRAERGLVGVGVLEPTVPLEHSGNFLGFRVSIDHLEVIILVAESLSSESCSTKILCGCPGISGDTYRFVILTSGIWNS
jgi:hypothetical protein